MYVSQAVTRTVIKILSNNSRCVQCCQELSSSYVLYPKKKTYLYHRIYYLHTRCILRSVNLLALATRQKLPLYSVVDLAIEFPRARRADDYNDSRGRNKARDRETRARVRDRERKSRKMLLWKSPGCRASFVCRARDAGAKRARYRDRFAGDNAISRYAWRCGVPCN